jgi:hypothetical protein
LQIQEVEKPVCPWHLSGDDTVTTATKRQKLIAHTLYLILEEQKAKIILIPASDISI